MRFETFHQSDDIIYWVCFLVAAGLASAWVLLTVYVWFRSK